MNEAYRQAVERLFSLQRFGIKLGLVHIGRLLRDLGDPRPGSPTVLIGGTNGKGSVAAMLAAIGQAAGRRTGLFTSPHLVSFTERVQVDGERIAPAAVVRLCDLLWAKLEPYRRAGEPEPITYFEMLTALAAQYFHERGVEWGVMEVGLGGRLDATNALPRDLVVLTDIGIDHVEYLGDTVPKIVAEKTALFRPGVPAVAAGGLGEAAALVAAEAERVGVPLALLGRDFDFEATEDGEIALHGTPVELPPLPVPLPGVHQRRNTAVAVRAALALGITGAQVLRAGLLRTSWPGRLETFSGEPEWLLDAAHNPAGAATLAEALPRDRRTVWLMTMMGDKDIDGVVAMLAPLVDAVVCTTLPMERAATPERLRRAVEAHNPAVVVEADADRAMEAAASLAGSTGRVLAAGSIFLIGHVRGRLTGETGP